VFGLSFGELCVLLIVAVVVLGPKDLPRYLRKAGQFAGKMRRLAYDMREKSGIDELLRSEGIEMDIAEIRRLARGEIGAITSSIRSAGDLVKPAGGTSTFTPAGAGATGATVPASAYAATQLPEPAPVVVDRQREYPCEGADSYGALPDTAILGDTVLPASPLAEDAVYTRGQAA